MQERLGALPASVQTTGAGAIWLHAVSVGEVLSAVELIRGLKALRPHLEVLVSTTTLAGRDTAEQRLAGLADGVFFAPLDYRSTVRRVLRRLRPALVAVLETEIWPNLYRESKRAGASLLIVNGRISDRALPRYRLWRGLFRYVLQWPDAILTQSAEDRRRFVVAGANERIVRVAGNLKYDFTPPPAVAPEIAALFERVKPDAIWIAASTTAPVEAGDPDEDEVVIEAFQRLSKQRGGLLLVLAPRRPERFPVVAEKLRQSGAAFIRRSDPGRGLSLPGVLLLDSIGELAPLFERATVVFMGGTLARRGGHNILEPAYFGKPVIVGPHMENFAAIIAEFSAAGAVAQVDGAAALAGAVEALLNDPPRRDEIGGKARDLAAAKRGVAGRVVQDLLAAAGDAVPNPPRTLAARCTLGPLSWIWRAGHRVNMARTKPLALSTKVVSVGALNMGGAGKSPLVAHLAARLAEAGRNPAILTRGYCRESSETVIVRRGDPAPADLTGDEAQIFVRQGTTHVGVGSNRYETGRRMERELKPDVFLLDDGFQHFRLKRDEDIVLIDALDPLGGGLFPLGRRREPLESLARATAVVIARAEGGTAGIEGMIRRYNARAPIFRSRVIPRGWVDAASGAECTPSFRRVAAFCGLGSPRSFWNTLAGLDLQVSYRKAFSDHHRYQAAELRELARSAAGADALVTTEKDAMNLPANIAETVAPLNVYYLRIGVEIENEAELMQRVR
jgi:3-deoxy-D-manno-octulosonic-acid transferase